MVDAARRRGRDRRAPAGACVDESTAARAARSSRRRCSPACSPTTASPATRCSARCSSVIEVDDARRGRSTSSTTSSTACRPRSTRATSTPRCSAVDRIDTGIVYVNAPTIGAEIPLPFGGTKHTGNGFREAGTPRHRAVQPDQDRLRRLLGPAAEGADRQPPRDGRAVMTRGFAGGQKGKTHA